MKSIRTNELKNLELNEKDLQWEGTELVADLKSWKYFQQFVVYEKKPEAENISQFESLKLDQKLLSFKLPYDKALKLLIFNDFSNTDNLLVNCFKYVIRKGELMNSLRAEFWNPFHKLIPKKVIKNFFAKIYWNVTLNFFFFIFRSFMNNYLQQIFLNYGKNR